MESFIMWQLVKMSWRLSHHVRHVGTSLLPVWQSETLKRETANHAKIWMVEEVYSLVLTSIPQWLNFETTPTFESGNRLTVTWKYVACTQTWKGKGTVSSLSAHRVKVMPYVLHALYRTVIPYVLHALYRTVLRQSRESKQRPILVWRGKEIESETQAEKYRERERKR